MTRAAKVTPHDLSLRFWGRVNLLAQGGCWEWTGALNEHGYGVTGILGRTALAHRVSLSAQTGEPLSSKLKALHSCDNPPCINPSHLRWGTQADNMADKVRRGRADYGSKPLSHCRKGHAMVEGNLYYRKNGDRRCRTCTLETNKAWKAGNGNLPA